MPDIAVVDYGMGNLRSVAKALAHVAPGRTIEVTADAAVIRRSPRVVLPGQSAMPDCMRCLNESGLRDVVLETEDGIRLGAWYLPGGRSAVLVFNGNAGDRSMRAPLAAALNRMGYTVLLFDYRGYGGNSGRPPAGLRSPACAAAWDRAASPWRS